MPEIMPPRPVALPVSPGAIPAELKGLQQWVLWRYEWHEGKWTKIPFTATGQPASSTDPATWTSFEEALTAYHAGGFDGIGLALQEENDLVGADLDHCRDPDTGDIDAWALEIIHHLQSYTEITPSGTGLRPFTKGKLPPGGRKKGNIEMYVSGRYLTVRLPPAGDADHDRVAPRRN
jgi:putative DNA primase/helicase